MPDVETFAPDVVNTLNNPRLLSAIRALLYSNNDRNQNAFFRTLLESTLIVLTQEAPRIPDGSILQYEEDGYAHYSKDTQIPLVQLNSDANTLILPAFTSSKYVHQIKGLSEFNGLAIETKDLLEVSIIAESSAICINPGSDEFLMLDRELILNLVNDLKKSSKIPKNDIVTLLNHKSS